jgi:CBS-domain-containing membrane protein
MTPAALKSLSIEHLPIPGTDPWHANPGDLALTVMTDFRERSSVTVTETSSVDSALDHMKHVGVRCAFATNTDQRVVGLVTAYDILGDAPLRHVQAMAGRRDDVLVRDIMRRPSEWKVLDVTDLERMTVGSLATLFEESRLSHIPVMESAAGGTAQLRGLLSGAKIRRLLSR